MKNKYENIGKYGAIFLLPQFTILAEDRLTVEIRRKVNENLKFNKEI